MSNFIYNNTSLPNGKSDLTVLPIGADGNKYVQSSEWNSVMQAMYDIRTAMLDNKFVNVKAYGAVCDGVANDYTAFAAAITAAGSNSVTLIIPGPMRIGTSYSIPSTVTLVFTGTGQLLPDGGQTITVNGAIGAGAVKIFGGAGTLNLGNSKTAFGILPQWFGAKGDGVTDDTAAIQVAMTAAGSSTVGIPKGYYVVSSTLTLAAQSLALVGESTANTVFVWNGTADGLMFRVGYKWQVLRNFRITGNCRGARCASLVTLNQKDATFDHIWFHNTGTYGVLIESGDGQAQCDNNTFNRCEFAGPATGLWLNSVEADFTHVIGCEFSGCSATGIRGQQGGFVTVRNTIFGTCAKDIEIQAGDSGLEQLYLDTVQGESHSSGYGIDIHSTCLTFHANQVIFGDKTFLATNNRYTFTSCYFNSPGIETNGPGVQMTEIGCWWASGATVTDLATPTRRAIFQPGGPGAGNVGEPARVPSLAIHPQQTPGTGTLKSYGTAASAVAMHQAFIDGVEVWRTIQDATNGQFCHGTPGGFTVKATANGASDLFVYTSDGAPANSRSSLQLVSGGSAGAGALIRLAVSGANSAVLSVGRNNGGVTLPPALELQYDDVTTAKVMAGGVVMSQSPRWYGAKGDGVTEDSTALQNCIDANKGGTVIIGPGRYLIAGVQLNNSTYNNTKIICAGGELVLKADGGSSTFGGAWVGLLIKDCSGVYCDLMFDGNRSAMTSREQIFCVGIAGASNVRIPRLEIREIRGDGLYVGQSDWTAVSTNPSNIQVGKLSAFNSANDGRNALSIISVTGMNVGVVDSYQVGAVVNGTLQPGGIDLEPNGTTDSVDDISNVTIGTANIVTAGTSGFQILGKSISGHVDSERLWNIRKVRVGNVLVRRTGSSGSGLAAANINRCLDVTINGDISYDAGNYGQGWQLDFCDRIAGTLKATTVSHGIHLGPLGEVRDFDLRVEVADYSTAGLKTCDILRGRFTGRISNPVSVSASTPFGIQAHNEGRVVTQTSIVYQVDVPYDSGASLPTKGFRNESSNQVTFTNCQVTNCDYTGYPDFPTMFDVNGVLPIRKNVAGLENTVAPTTGRWNSGEVVPNSAGTMSAGAVVRTGWMRLTTGTTNTYGTDWAALYSQHSAAETAISVANGATGAIDLTTGSFYYVTATGAAITIGAPTGGIQGQELEITIKNGSGGALTTTWTSSLGFRLAGAWVDPADTKQRSIKFRYEASTGIWREFFRSAADV